MAGATVGAMVGARAIYNQMPPTLTHSQDNDYRLAQNSFCRSLYVSLPPFEQLFF
jgi:hypothetical protein